MAKCIGLCRLWLTDTYYCVTELYEKAVRIIRDYFDGEDDEDFDFVAPEIDFDSRQFAFGTENQSAGGNQFIF